MGRFLRISNGMMRSFDEAATAAIYDQTYTVAPGGLAANTPISLPNSQTYATDGSLKVFLNGTYVNAGNVDYSYVGSGPTYTQIQFPFALLAGELVRFRIG